MMWATYPTLQMAYNAACLRAKRTGFRHRVLFDRERREWVVTDIYHAMTS